MDNRDFTRCVEVRQVATQGAQVIVNGQVMQQTTTVLCCPNCNNIVLSLGNNLSDLDVLKVCTANKQVLQEQYAHCPRCTQRLSFPEIVAQLCDAQ